MVWLLLSKHLTRQLHVWRQFDMGRCILVGKDRAHIASWSKFMRYFHFILLRVLYVEVMSVCRPLIQLTASTGIRHSDQWKSVPVPPSLPPSLPPSFFLQRGREGKRERGGERERGREGEGEREGERESLHPSLSLSLHVSLSPSLPLSLPLFLPLCLSPSLPLSLSPSLPLSLPFFSASLLRIDVMNVGRQQSRERAQRMEQKN